ncbi:glycosyltransferase [Enterococcus sp. JM9B]|uniref:glycosyltransferase n=1 Tax=Enterococcus sp. JM9B TaxID=1857216 RepID=UPI0013750F23|nr:glycosyltransferase [Enterococcus sp. JM9B]KAF1302993.1 hypothetical protein BAU16_05825 [Enterococcus sp. JM9B]
MKNILYVTTISNTINSFLVPHIALLLKQGHQVSVACRVKETLHPSLEKVIVYDLPFERRPFHKNNLKAYRQFKNIINKNFFDIVHTHTPIASAIVRFACRNQASKVFYTAHGFHFFEGAPLKNWLVYYPVERVLARHTDVLMTINEQDTKIAQTFSANKIVHIPGIGFDWHRYQIKDTIAREQLRRELNIPIEAKVMISIGELNDNKNHLTGIKALAKMKEPIFYLICGSGDHLPRLQGEVQKHGLTERVIFLGNVPNVRKYLNIADFSLFISKREGLGLAGLEAMASGLPLISSFVGGIRDYTQNNITGITIRQPENVAEVTAAIQQVVNYSPNQKKNIGGNNRKIAARYQLDYAVEAVNKFY